MYVKICGIIDPHTADFTVRAGADAIGVVSYPRSPRHIEADHAQSVLRAARDAAAGLGRAVDTVLVVRGIDVNEAIARMAAYGTDVLQLHGGYSPADFAVAREAGLRVWRAASLADEPEIAVGECGEERLLLDGSAPGSGDVWDVDATAGLSLGSEWLLAGGLSPANVAALLMRSGAGGADVSSGVESSRGVKDLALIEAFVTNAKGAAAVKPGD